MCPFGQNCMMGKPLSAVNSGIALIAMQVDSAQVKVEFRLKLTIPDGPEPLCI